MNEIAQISTSRMDNGAHFAYHTATVNYVEADVKVKTKVASLLAVYKSALAKEDEALKTSQKSFLTDEIAEADSQRDAFYLGFKNTVKAFAATSDAAMKQAHKALSQLIKDYRIDPAAQIDKETGLMTNLISDLEGKYKAEMEKLSLTTLVASMKAANERVATSLSARNAENSTRQVGILKATRLIVDEAYRMLIKHLNAYALVEGETDYANFFAQMNTFILRYKRQVLGQKTTSSTNGGSGSDSGDGGDDGEAPDPTPPDEGEAPDPTA